MSDTQEAPKKRAPRTAPAQTSILQSGYPVSAAFLHQAICWPGVCGAEKTINKVKVKGVVLTVLPQGLLLEAKGKKCLVPHTNVINYILD
jgi:hypothetical protein